MLKILIRWCLLATAMLLIAHLLRGVEVRSFGAAMTAALVLGLLNALVRPLLVMLTFPVTLVTLGLFLFVINALMFYGAAWLMDGLFVDSFWTAMLASLIYGLCGLVIESALTQFFPRPSR